MTGIRICTRYKVVFSVVLALSAFCFLSKRYLRDELHLFGCTQFHSCIGNL